MKSKSQLQVEQQYLLLEKDLKNSILQSLHTPKSLF